MKSNNLTGVRQIEETQQEALKRLRSELLKLPEEHPMKYCDPILIYRGMLDMEGNFIEFEKLKRKVKNV